MRFEALNINKQSTLEEQLERSEIMEIGGEKLEIFDLQSESPPESREKFIGLGGKLLTLEEALMEKGLQREDIEKDRPPCVVLPGWAAYANPRFGEFMVSLAEEHRRVIGWNAPHGVPLKEMAEKTEEYPEAELRKVEALFKILEKKDIGKIDAIGHSEANLYLLIAAALHPEKFRSLTLVDPAGMIGKDNVGRLTWGLLKDLGVQVAKSFADLLALRGGRMKRTLNMFHEANKAILKNPSQAVKQVFAISTVQIHEMLREIKRQGVKVLVFHGANDKVFPMARVQQTIVPYEDPNKPSRSGKYKDMVDGFFSVGGTHNFVVVEPRRYGKAVNGAMTTLEINEAVAKKAETKGRSV